MHTASTPIAVNGFVLRVNILKCELTLILKRTKKINKKKSQYPRGKEKIELNDYIKSMGKISPNKYMTEKQKEEMKLMFSRFHRVNF